MRRRRISGHIGLTEGPIIGHWPGAVNKLLANHLVLFELQLPVESDRNSVSVTVSAPKLPNFLVSAWFRLRPLLAFWFRPGFGYGRDSKFSFGIVTASRNSDIEFGKHGIILQPFPNAVSACPYTKLASSGIGVA